MYDKYNIVCLSSADWDAELWTNRQQVMCRLSENHRVLYIEGALSIISSFRTKKGFKRWFKWLEGVRRISNNLSIYSPLPILPFRRQIRLFNKISSYLSSYFIRRIIRKMDFRNVMLWVYCPLSAEYIGKFNEILSVYDCVDEHSGYPGEPRRYIMKREEELLKKVDMVFVTARGLLENKQKFNKNTFFVHNVGDYSIFSKTMDHNAKIDKEMNGINPPIIGFFGAINYKIDINLIRKIALSRPKWSLVLIGPCYLSNDELEEIDIENIYLLGKKPIQALPSYIKAFDICIIPYVINRYTKTVFPLKFFEYLATGKPIVSTNLPELKIYGNLIALAKNYTDFIRKCEIFLEKREEKDIIDKKIKLARNNTWESRIERMLSLIARHMSLKKTENLAN